jgi:hypothetical protein
VRGCIAVPWSQKPSEESLLLSAVSEYPRKDRGIVALTPARLVGIDEPRSRRGPHSKIAFRRGTGFGDQIRVLARQREPKASRVLARLDRAAAPFGLSGEWRRGEDVESSIARQPEKSALANNLPLNPSIAPRICSDR